MLCNNGDCTLSHKYQCSNTVNTVHKWLQRNVNIVHSPHINNNVLCQKRTVQSISDNVVAALSPKEFANRDELLQKNMYV